MADVKLWHDLAALDRSSLKTRTGAQDRGNEGFCLPLFNGQVQVNPHQRTFALEKLPVDPDFIDHHQVPVLGYCLQMEKRIPSGTWLNPKELTGGAMFFRGPHQVPAALLSSRFGEDGPGFCRAAELLGGTPLAFGDLAYRLEPLPAIPVGVVLWLGDDEFSARSSVLVDRSADRLLALDALLGILTMSISALLQAAGPFKQEQ